MKSICPKALRRTLSCLILAFLLIGADAVQTREAMASPPPGTILFIGNSFVRGVRRNVKKLFITAGYYSRIKGSAPNGWHLADHTLSTRTYRRISKTRWDIIIFQEHSDGLSEATYPDVRFLTSQAAANGSDSMLFMVWRDRGEPASAYDNLLGVPGGVIGHLPIALELDIPIAPVGWAIRNSIVNGPPYDFWQDGHHLNGRGRYLEGCIFFAALTGESPVGGWKPGNIGDAEALFLQQLAADTVLTDPAQWNLDF